jgi:hypothetical protein
MMTKRIENPAAVHGRQNQARPWLSVGTSSRLRQAYVAAKLCHFEHLATRARHSEATAACSSAEFARIRTGGAPSAKSTDEQELVPTGDRERRTVNVSIS